MATFKGSPKAARAENGAGKKTKKFAAGGIAGQPDLASLLAAPKSTRKRVAATPDQVRMAQKENQANQMQKQRTAQMQQQRTAQVQRPRTIQYAGPTNPKGVSFTARMQEPRTAQVQKPRTIQYAGPTNPKGAPRTAQVQKPRAAQYAGPTNPKGVPFTPSNAFNNTAVQMKQAYGIKPESSRRPTQVGTSRTGLAKGGVVNTAYTKGKIKDKK